MRQTANPSAPAPFVFHQGTAPLLISIPHGGVYVPPLLAERFGPEARAVLLGVIGAADTLSQAAAAGRLSRAEAIAALSHWRRSSLWQAGWKRPKRSG